MSTITPTRRLADTLLDGGLDAFVLDRRAQKRSWRLISLDLRDETGLDVTFETLRNWYAEPPEPPAPGEHRPALTPRRPWARRLRGETPPED